MPTAREIAEKIGARIEGVGGIRLEGIAPLDRAGPADLSFLTNKKYLSQAAESRSPVILTHEFCHLYTGLWLGWLYLPVYGLEYLIAGHGRSPHERLTMRFEERNRYTWRPL